MKAIKDLPIEEIDRIFREATKRAQEEADEAGLPRFGTSPLSNGDTT